MLRSPKSQALFFAGLIYFFMGVAQWGSARELTPTTKKAVHAQLALFPLSVWGIIFSVIAAFAMICSFKKWFIPGFFSLILVSVWWSLLYVASFMATGYGRTWIGFLTWTLISIFFYIISVWPDPVVVVQRPGQSDEHLFDFGDDKNVK